MPTATAATAKKATATATGSGAIAAQINSTQAALETIRQQQAELMNDERRAEAELHAQQQQLTTAREAEAAAAAEQQLSEDLKALKAKAQVLNESSAALAKLYGEFKALHQKHLSAQPPQGIYANVSTGFNVGSLPFVALKEGSAEVRLTSLGQQPKQ